MNSRWTRTRAFTLIELLVVILVVAILLAVAAPSFLGQQDKAHDNAAKQHLSVARKALKAIYTSDGGQVAYPSAATLLTLLEDAEPQFEFVQSPAPATYTATSVERHDAASVSACVQSRTNTFFCLRTFENGDGVQLASAAAGLWPFAVRDAFAAADVVYSNGASESAARCVVDAAADAGDYSACGSARPGWSAPVAGSAPTSTTPTQTTPTLAAPAGGNATLSGTVAQGSTLTASAGTFTGTPAPALTYRWQRDSGTGFTDIAGATDATYVVAGADGGATLRVVVTATNTEGTATSTSAATVAVPQTYEQAVGADDPVALWRFEPGATLTDSSAHANAISSNSGVTFTTGARAGSQAAVFGAGQLNIPNPLAAATQFSFEAYIYQAPYSGSSYPTLWSMTKPNGSDHEQVHLAQGSGNVWYFGTRSATVSHNTTYAAPPANTWTHVVLTLDAAKTPRLYLNGVLQAPTGGTNPWTRTPASIGATSNNWLGKGPWPADPLWTGRMDDVAFYTRALTATEVAAHYDAG